MFLGKCVHYQSASFLEFNNQFNIAFFDITKFTVAFHFKIRVEINKNKYEIINLLFVLYI